MPIVLQIPAVQIRILLVYQFDTTRFSGEIGKIVFSVSKFTTKFSLPSSTVRSSKIIRFFRRDTLYKPDLYLQDTTISNSICEAQSLVDNKYQ